MITHQQHKIVKMLCGIGLHQYEPVFEIPVDPRTAKELANLTRDARKKGDMQLAEDLASDWTGRWITPTPEGWMEYTGQICKACGKRKPA